MGEKTVTSSLAAVEAAESSPESVSATLGLRWGNSGDAARGAVVVGPQRVGFVSDFLAAVVHQWFPAVGVRAAVGQAWMESIGC
mgnify:CR=1 FL=1